MNFFLHRREITFLFRFHEGKRLFVFNTCMIESKFFLLNLQLYHSFISFFRQCLASVEMTDKCKLSLAFSFLVKEIDDGDNESDIDNRPPDVVSALTALLKSCDRRIHYIVPGLSITHKFLTQN